MVEQHAGWEGSEDRAGDRELDIMNESSSCGFSQWPSDDLGEVNQSALGATLKFRRQWAAIKMLYSET